MTEPVFIRETNMPTASLAERLRWFSDRRKEAHAMGAMYDRTCNNGARMLFEAWYERPAGGCGAPRWST